MASHGVRGCSRPLRPCRYPPAPRARSCIPRATAHDDESPLLAIVGGGAAGLAAAFFAATTTTAITPRVVLLERNADCGRKILISGGTRCNALPAHAVPPDGAGCFHHGGRQAALRGVLGAGWSVDDCRAWLSAEAGVELVEEAGTAKLFPASRSAASVRDGLVAAAVRAGAAVQTAARVVGLDPSPGGRWSLRLEAGPPITADAVVLATGGLSYPGLGTTGDGHAMAARLGVSLAADPPRPALAPLLGRHPGGGVGGREPCHLAGTAVHTALLSVREAGKKKAAPASPRRSFLFTHRGFSGPAALDASRFVSGEAAAGAATLLVQWVEGMGVAEWSAALAAGGAAGLAAVLRAAGLPARLAAALVAEAGAPPDRRAAELRAGERDALLTALTAYPLAVTGVDGGWGKAEVTAGGVALADLSPTSLESRAAPGVFMCGELVAPAGRLGGFNFYWAWASGRVAGMAAAAAAAAAWEGRRGGGEAGWDGAGHRA